ncbi:MAG: toxin HicA [Kofleriaceae bacterium]
MRAGREIHFADLKKVCEAYFGAPRTSGSSHFVFKTPWPFDPRVNIQDEKGKAKAYQVRQVVKAIDKLIEIRAAAAKGKPPKKK